ncbi:uncharacterized protein BDV17DRAFT_277412 [Aspergillus undulatus]|uniref:uncharacterized protein n=1 Tax=Aspergillus undulatus TaxID=1810928 RepID=UPI003CCDD786
MAARVCTNCKARKKKCDKALPCCRYCAEKGIRCVYQEQKDGERVRLVPYPSRALSLTDNPSSSSPEGIVCREAQRILTPTGLYLDEVSVRYFESVHCYFPIITRQRFHGQLISFGSHPRADFSILLLCMALHLNQPENKRIDTATLYFATKGLYSQAQCLGTPTLNLIQAGVLLALYEYAQGEPERAFITIGGSARMAYAAGLRSLSSLPTPTSPEIDDADAKHSNTLWGIAICERLFLSELAIMDQPLLSAIPNDVHDFSDSSFGCCQTDSLHSTSLINGWRQAARATCLMDQLLSAISAPEESPWATLEKLDKALQMFLGETIQEAQGMTMYCLGISIAVRSLFLLHRRILSPTTRNFDRPKEAESNSRAALDTVTKIVADVAETHQHLSARQLDTLPLSYAYNVRAAVEYIRDKCQPLPPGSWLRDSGLRLERELDRLKFGGRIGGGSCSLAE